MLDVLTFAFRDGWHFAGCTLWLVCICGTVAHLAHWTPVSVRRFSK